MNTFAGTANATRSERGNGKSLGVAAQGGGCVFPAIEDFAGAPDAQDAFLFAAFVVADADGFWIHVAQVCLAAGGFGNSRGENDFDAWFFDAIFVGADTLDVGGVSDNAPGVFAVLIPLLQEEVPGVISDFLENGAMHGGDFGDMRGVDDHLAAIRDDGFDLVHALSARPEVVVHFRCAGKDGMEGLILVADVQVAREIGGGGPGVLGGPRIQAGEVMVPDHHAEGAAFGADHGGGAVHHLTDGGPLVADDDGVGDDGAQPVEEINDILAGDAGEQVLVAAGEADDFVGEDRADDHQEIVIVDHAVAGDIHVHFEAALGDIADFLARETSDAGDMLGVFPLVVEEAGLGIAGGVVVGGDAHALVDLILRHGGVGSQGNQKVQGLDAVCQTLIKEAEHHVQWAGSGVIRHDEEHAFAFRFPIRQSAVTDFRHICFGEKTVVKAHANGGTICHFRFLFVLVVCLTVREWCAGGWRVMDGTGSTG
jgi:hypothetical protein